MTLKKQT